MCARRKVVSLTSWRTNSRWRCLLNNRLLNYRCAAATWASTTGTDDLLLLFFSHRQIVSTSMPAEMTTEPTMVSP